MEITYLKGVGPKRAELYKKLGVEKVEQLVELYPRDYVDFTCPKPIAEVQTGEVCAFRAFVKRKTAPFSEYSKMALYKAELSDGTGNILLTDGLTGLKEIVLFLPRRCVIHIPIPTTGEKAVASAAPSIPSPHGNIRT